jgi:hypothetical protein
VIHEDGRVFAVALADDDVIVAAAEVPEEVDLDEDTLPSFEYLDDIGAALDPEYRRGAAARIVAHFALDA